MYLAIKHLHMTCVALSLCGFVLRGIWMIARSPLLDAQLTRVMPHVVDTLLLGSAVVLSVMMAQYPFVHGWLTAKVLGLLAYIGFGTIALKRGRTVTQRVLALVAALLSFAFIVSVALSKSPAGFFA
ncbi:MAG: SirB2 family protein [Rhodocyclaceae bacterium]|nr:SirB2 family protein [Rhodocyclaceae bacterium]